MSGEGICKNDMFPYTRTVTIRFKYRVRQIPFFGGKCLKKTTEYFLKFLFLFKSFFRLIMENNFIQMAAAAGNAVVYTIGPIFKHIIDCVHLYFTNGFTNIIL